MIKIYLTLDEKSDAILESIKPIDKTLSFLSYPRDSF